MFGGSNSTRHIEECVVERIGKKYLYLKKLEHYPVDKETLKYANKVNSTYNVQYYLDRQVIVDMEERSALLSKLEVLFRWSTPKNHITLDQLREAVKIFNL
jgi:hypothetical protein